MIVDKVCDKDIIAYLFTDDVVKFGVVSRSTAENVTVRCLTKDTDGFWMYKNPIVEIPVDRANLILNMTNECSIMGKTSNNLKKVKIIVPQKIISDLKIMKEELKIVRNRSGILTLNTQNSGVPLTEEFSARKVEEMIEENTQQEKPVGQREQIIVEENTEQQITPVTTKKQEETLALDSDPEISPVDEDTKKEIEKKVTQLQKRPPKLTKKQIAANRRAEVKLIQIVQEKKVRTDNSVKFARNTTTNIRFDPLRLGIGMLTKKDKQEEPAIERIMTNEINFGIEVSNTITLVDMLNEFMTELKESTESKLLTFRIISTVPSKTDIETCLSQLAKLTDWIDSAMHLMDEDKQLAKQGLALWHICFKFLNSLETAALYRLKDELIAERALSKSENDCKSDRICHDLRQVVFMMNSFVVHMDELSLKNFYAQKAKLLIVILQIEAKSGKMYKMFFQYYMQLVDALNVSDECNEPLAEVTEHVLMNVTFSSDIKKALDDDQLDPIVFKFKSLLIKSQLRLSSKYWTLLVSSASKVIEQVNPDLPNSLISKPEKMMKPWIDKVYKEESASFEKAFLLAALKLVMINNLVELTTDSKGNKRFLNSILRDLSTSEAGLPFFVCYYQALSQKMTNTDDIRDLNIGPLSTFMSKYVARTEADILQDLKVKVSFSKELENSWNVMRDTLQSTEDEVAAANEMIRALNSPSTKVVVKAEASKPKKQKFIALGAADNNVNETLPEPLETYMFWVNLINEVYLPHILNKVPDSVMHMKTIIATQSAKLTNDLSEENRRFLLALVTNFEDMPIMSINPGMVSTDVRVRVIIVHMMAQFMLLNHENEFLALSSNGQKSLYQRDQLCAFPGDEEEKYRIIAQMIYDKEYNQWSSSGGYDVTSLNQCPCGYYYFIGNCGKPYQEYECPACKKQIGGTGHKYVSDKPQLVTNKEFLKMYGALEKKTAKRYTPRDLSKVDFSISMRLIFGALNFKLIEFMTHARYLLEFTIGSNKEIKGLSDMITLTQSEIPEYLLNYCKECFKAPVSEFKSEVKAFNWMHCLVRSLSSTDDSLNFSKAKRNNYERLISKKIDHFLVNKETIVKSVHNKADKEDNERTKRLMVNWINFSASLDEFKSCFPNIDLRVVTALKNNIVDTRNINLDDELKKQLQSVYPDPSLFPLVRFAISHIELLQAFRPILTSIVELSNHLADKLDCSITWKEACALSISDLTAVSQTMMKNEEIEEIIDRYGNDQELKQMFANFCQQWSVLMQLKDKFSQQLEFRFMCHGNIFSDQTIKELTDPTKAKVAFFLVTESNVESLIINSLLQTLSAFQTNLLKTHTALFQAINGTKPMKASCQTINSADLVEISNLSDLIASCARFAKDSEVPEFNLELLERLIAEEMFLGRPMLAFTDSTITNFNVKFDFNQTFNRITEIGRIVPQVKMTDEQRKSASSLIKLNASLLFSEYQKLIKMLHMRKSHLTELEHLSFDDALISLNDLTVANLKDLYEMTEIALTKKAVRNLDVLFQTEIPEEKREALRKKINSCTHLELLQIATKRLILRQLMGSSSDKLAATGLKIALEYSDGIVDDDQGDLLDEALQVIDDDTTISQAMAFCNLMSSTKN